MNKKLILSRLWSTIEMLYQLKEEDFRYNSFIAESHNHCGTVCCVAGWYPKYFPESGLRWMNGEEGILQLDSGYPWDVNPKLIKHHGVSFYLIEILFYGTKKEVELSDLGYDLFKSINQKWIKLVSIFQSNEEERIIEIGVRGGVDLANLKEVRSIFEFVYYMIDNEYIVNHKN